MPRIQPPSDVMRIVNAGRIAWYSASRRNAPLRFGDADAPYAPDVGNHRSTYPRKKTRSSAVQKYGKAEVDHVAQVLHVLGSDAARRHAELGLDRGPGRGAHGSGLGELREGRIGRRARHEPGAVSYTHLRAHETRHDLVCRLL